MSRESPVETRPRDADRWDPALLETLHSLVHQANLETDALGAELQLLESEHGDEVYAELVFLLSHLRFPGPEAKEHWQRIGAHREEMRRRLKTPVDSRVALLSYFIGVNRRLENPTIIEMKLFEETRSSAYRDELTGLCNYRMFREHLDREMARAQRDRTALSVAMIDVDDFKIYNDGNGHEAGNDALIALGHILSATLRKPDVAARYGGEEFALILPATPKANAQIVAERIRRRIEEHGFANERALPGGTLTASIGVATFPGDAREPGGLVRYADVALYTAKSRGKNRVHLYGDDRRSFRRVGASLEGTYRVAVAEFQTASTVDVSESGVLLRVNERLSPGALVEFNLRVPGESREIAASGRVVRVEECGDDRFEAAIRILEMDTRDQNLLSRYLTSHLG